MNYKQILAVDFKLDRLVSKFEKAKALNDVEMMESFTLEFTDLLATVLNTSLGQKYYRVLVSKFGYTEEEANDFYEMNFDFEI